MQVEGIQDFSTASVKEENTTLSLPRAPFIILFYALNLLVKTEISLVKTRYILLRVIYDVSLCLIIN